MRTSNKILIGIFILFTVSLIVYDLNLKAEYKKGDYANPFRGYVALNYRDFDEVELDASTAVNIILVQGPFKVMANPDAMEFVTVSKHNKRLIVGASFSDHFQGFNAAYILYISCPKLKLFDADTRYLAAGIQVTDTVALNFNWKPTVIRGFTLDSLSINEDNASNLVLDSNKITKLNATIGQGKNSSPIFTIDKYNQFTQSDLNLLNKSRLVIKGAISKNLKYNLADSATLIVNGAAVNHILNIK
jgi:hypothetical protein